MWTIKMVFFLILWIYFLNYLKKAASLAGKRLEVWDILEDPSLDVLQLVLGQIQILQIAKFVKDPRCQL